MSHIYRTQETLRDRDVVAKTYDEYTKWLVGRNFVKVNIGGDAKVRGRRYDAATILTTLDFEDKKVCELGARDGLLGSYLSTMAQSVAISDNFKDWDDLQGFEYWQAVWSKASPNPDRVKIANQNILNLDYEDGSFDVVIATSVLDHMATQTDKKDGHVVGMAEMVRICKPGGYICISILTAPETVYASGSLVQSPQDIQRNIIGDLEVVTRDDEAMNWNFDGCDETQIHDVTAYNVLLVLRKPE
jgi:SAM-dependent methyltransferase